MGTVTFAFALDNQAGETVMTLRCAIMFARRQPGAEAAAPSVTSVP
jgi:hypothetical protein